MGGPLRVLKEKHKVFVENYLIHFVGARAARDAGYEPSNSRVLAWNLLHDPLIIEYMKKRSGEIMAEIKEEQLKIFRELMKVGHSKIRDLYTPAGALKPLDEWPEDIAACVSSIKQKVRTATVGGITTTTKSLEVRLWNKNQALDILSKVTGLQTSELKVSLPDNVGSLYFPAPKAEGAPVDEAIVARDIELKLIQGEKSGHGHQDQPGTKD